jgi:hypothetical protein
VRGEPHEIARDEAACTFLVLPRVPPPALSAIASADDEDAAVRVRSPRHTLLVPLSRAKIYLLDPVFDPCPPLFPPSLHLF